MYFYRKAVQTNIIFLIIISSIYFVPDYYLSGVRLPNVTPVFLASILLFLNVSSRQVWYSLTRFLISIVILLSLGLIAVPEYSLYFNERITGTVQLFFSIYIFSICVINVVNVDVKKIDSMILVLYFTLLIIAMLERTGLLFNVSELIRNSLYGFSMYSGYERDIRSYGFVRPMAFMKEPAHFAWLVSILGFYLYKRNVITIKIIITIGFVFLYLISSPICLILFSALLIDYEIVNKSRVVITLPVFSLFIILIINLVFESRIDGFLNGTDISVLSRLVGPPLITLKVLQEYPFFGLGLTADTLVTDYVYAVFFYFSEFGALDPLDDTVLAKRVTNYFFQSFVYLGLAGVLIIIYIFNCFLRNYLTPKELLSTVSIFIVFSLGMGGLVTPRVFIGLYLIFVCYYNFKSENDEC